MLQKLQFDIPSLHTAYRDGLAPDEVMGEVFRRIEEVTDPGIFICLEERERIESGIRSLGEFDPQGKPLWGVPFVVKDNVDVRGLPTTAACPAYSYNPERDAYCVSLLREAGAILIGKTNLDQFATGLVGVRTPFPVPKNAIDSELVPGGSSSGSAVAVAHGIVSFSLGTDTAGSGRVPAGLNNIVGLKPTLGSVSNTGVVPACRTLDTISIFALNVGDANAVYQQISCFDETDPYARRFPGRGIGPAPTELRVGVPDERTREFCGDAVQKRSYEESLAALQELGADLVAIDFRPFYEVADLLYSGAWVAERDTVIEALLKEDPSAIHPVTRRVVEVANQFSATDAFRHFYHAAELKAEIRKTVQAVDMLCVPTMPTHYRVSEVEKDPIGTNSRLGTYTNFVNILDFCALTVPIATRGDGWPGSITLIAEAGRDGRLADIGHLIHEQSGVTAGATSWPIAKSEPVTSACSEEIAMAVVGAHMTGLPLNRELTSLGARFLERTATASCYNLYALEGGPPKRPGLVRNDHGQSIEIEIWAMPTSQFGSFMGGVPQPLGIGSLDLIDGRQVKGFICESAGLLGAEDITSFGGWRNYLNSIE